MHISTNRFDREPSTIPSAIPRARRVLGWLMFASGAATLFHSAMLAAAPLARDTPERERLDRAVAEARDAVAEGGSQFGKGALVYLIPSTDGVPRGVRSEIHNSYPSGGYKPGNVHEGDAIIEYGSDSVVRELRLLVPGRELFSRSFRFRHGEVIVWDDVALPALTARSAGSIRGSIWLEGDPPLKGITVHADDRESGVETDENGLFTLEGVRRGKVRVSAHKAGYRGLLDDPTVEPGRTTTVELDGYLVRNALVHWAYISDETRDFKGPAVKEGTAIVNPTHEGLNRVSFAAGFERVNAKSDFLINQIKDSLTINNTDDTYKGPGIVKLSGVKFHEVETVPNLEFSSKKILAFERGDLFLLRCFDGKRYAKLEVLDIFAGDVPPEAMRRLIKNR